MPYHGGAESDQLLTLQRRGLELATREAEDRCAEINSILSSRRVLRAAERDPSIRETRLSILEELARDPYPNMTVLAAARHLGAPSGHLRISRLRHHSRTRRVHGLRQILGGTVALVLCVMAAAGLLTARAFNSVDDGQTLTVLVTCLPFVAFVAGLAGGWSARLGARQSATGGALTRSYLIAGLAWFAALVLLLSGIGETAVGAHFVTGILFVWSAFVALSFFVAGRLLRRRQWRAGIPGAVGGSRKVVTA